MNLFVNQNLLLLVTCLLSMQWLCSGDGAETTTEGECDDPSNIRIIKEEELAGKVSKNGDEIWLSILGEVYDVSEGTEYYSGEEGYGVFAGRDCSLAYITGEFTLEECAKGLDELSGKQLASLDHWKKFYRDHEKYKFVGRLEGRFYDKEGNPTKEMEDVQEKIDAVPKKKKAAAKS
mmetsp:Transcript_21066/g.29740  ORF Transcript_21066/g.29740 Transcript_21066/m.29740 type:complete len:177 (+) Transcript_21066:174-704(+)